MPKRGRPGYVSSYAAGAQTRRKQAARRRAWRRFGRRAGVVPGITRTGGYYGRFAGPDAELKFHDVSVTDATIASVMTINNLTIIPQDTTESTRIGRKIVIRKIHWKYSMTLPVAVGAGSTSDIVKVMLVLDQQTNGAAFAATDLIETDIWSAFRNLSNSKRFRVLYSKNIQFKAGGATPSGAAHVFSEDMKYVVGNKTCNIPIEYDNTAQTGAIGTVRSNNLYWVTQSISGIIGGVGTVRLRFSDK